MDTRAEVRRMVKAGVPKARIARELGLSRTPVVKCAKDLGPPRRETRNPRVSKLEPYKGCLGQRVAAEPLLWAIRLLHEIQGRGYAGGYTLVKDFLRRLRAAGKVQAVLRFETEPGVQAQVDWAHFGSIDLDGRRHRLYLFSLVLGYSRARYVEFTVRTDTATFVQCHLNAFVLFGGWTQEILYDNTRNVVLKRAQKVDGSTRNPLFEDFRRHFGFAARPVDSASRFGVCWSLMSHALPTTTRLSVDVFPRLPEYLCAPGAVDKFQNAISFVGIIVHTDSYARIWRGFELL